MNKPTTPDALLLNPLTALSPLDGRYAAKVEPLRAHFSEFPPRTHALPVAQPVHVLQIVQEHRGALQVAGEGARAHPPRLRTDG